MREDKPALHPTLRQAAARMLLQWHVTERCNLRCTHCYQETDSSPELGWSEWMTLLDQFRQLLEAIPSCNAKPPRGHVTVTGGEPFVHPDFVRLLEMLSSDRSRWSFAILTNGTLIDDRVAQRLAELRPSFVQVSVEGSETTHDRIRGCGAFARAVEGLRNLVRHRLPTMISFTAQADNYREFPEVANLGRRLGVRRVWADRVVPLGRSDGGQILTATQTREFVELLHRERRRRALDRRTEIAAHRALQFALGTGAPYRCSAGDTLITVLANGDVCPCRRMPSAVGNVLSTSLRELYLTSPLLRTLRERAITPAGCETCFYARTCLGGLRCLSAAVYGNPFVADPGCWMARRGEKAAVHNGRSQRPECATSQDYRGCDSIKHQEDSHEIARKLAVGGAATPQRLCGGCPGRLGR